MADEGWVSVDNRSPWDRFKDSYLSGALHSPFGGEGAARLYLKYVEGYTDDQITEAEKRVQQRLGERQAKDPTIRGSGFDVISPSNIGRAAVDLLGNLAGGADPTYVLSPGKTIAQRIAAQAGINAGMDAASQGVELKRGLRDRYDPWETVLNAGAGAVFQGGLEARRYFSGHRSTGTVPKGTSLVTSDNVKGGAEGPTEGPFRTPKDAARHIVTNKLGGTHDIVAHSDGSYSVEQTRGFDTPQVKTRDLIQTIKSLEGGGTLENPKTSKKGALGPMQVMPDTARDPGFGIKPWNGKSQKDLQRVGVQYAAALNKHYDGDVTKVLAAYNGGFGRVDNLIKKYGDNWLQHMPKETRKYVAKGLSEAPQPIEHGNSGFVENDQNHIDNQAYVNSWLAPEEETFPTSYNDFQQSFPLVKDMYLSSSVREVIPDDLKHVYDHLNTGKSIFDIPSHEYQKLNDFLEKNPELVSLENEIHQKPMFADEDSSAQKPFSTKKEEALYNLNNKNYSTETNPLTAFANDLWAAGKYPTYHDAFVAAQKEWSIKDTGPKPGTPEFDKKYGYHQDLAIDDEDYGYVYDDSDEFKAFEDEGPQSHYDYIGSLLPYDQYTKNTGIHIDLNQKHAIEHVAKKLGVHPWDVAEAYLNKDDSVGLSVDDTIDEVNKYLNYLDKDSPLHPENSSKPKYYAPYSEEDHYINLKDYESQKGKIGPLTKQALIQYASDNGLSKSSVESHYFSKNGDPTIKEGVTFWRDNLAKEQMTPKEYAAYQKLPTKDPKVLKILKKYLEPQMTPEQKALLHRPSKLKKAANAFVTMLKDNNGSGQDVEGLHNFITEWNNGTHYLMKGPDGKPLRIYHGTHIPYEGMPSGEKNQMPKGYVLYSTDPHFASGYAKFSYDTLNAPAHSEYYGHRASRVFPAYVKNDKAIADFRKPEDLMAAISWYKKNRGISSYGEKDLADGNWDLWENPQMLKDNGWKGAFMTEGGSVNIMLEDHLVQSVFDPKTYKNTTFAHKLIKTLRNLLHDESGALDLDKLFEKMFGGDKAPNERYEGLGPEAKLEKAIKESRPASLDSKKLLHEYHQAQNNKLRQIQHRGGSHFEELSALKGKAPSSAKYESVAGHFTPEDVKALEFKINQAPGLTAFDKFNAKKALHKLVSEEGFSIPSPHELHLLGESVSPNVVRSLLNKDKTLDDKIKDALLETSGLFRSFEASGDVSFPFRQGIQLIGRPEFWKNIPKMLHMGISPENHKKMMLSIKKDPDFQMMKDAGVYFHNENGFALEREESFMSNLAENLPGQKIPVLGVVPKAISGVVRASDRAFTGYANLIRAASAKAMIRSSEKMGINLKTDERALKAIGEYVNTSTGRGSLGKFEQSARALSTVFFSPRLAAARIKMMHPGYWVKMFRDNPVVFRRAVGDMVAMTVFASTVMGLAKLAGAEITTDPTSVDFGKVKIGRARFSLLGGYESFIRLGFELVYGTRTNAEGKKFDLDSGKFGEQTRYDRIVGFIRNKLAPIPGYLASAAKGTTPSGEKFDAKKEAWHGLIPLGAQDISDVIGEFGAAGMFAIPAIALGIGGQVYKERPPKEKKSKKKDSGWVSVGGPSNEEPSQPASEGWVAQ